MIRPLVCFFFFSSRRRHTRSLCDWSSDVCSSDLIREHAPHQRTVVYDEDAGPAVRERWHRRPPTGFPPGRPPRRTAPSVPRRSEERRVGKECRSRWSGEQWKKKREKEGSEDGTRTDHEHH